MTTILKFMTKILKFMTNFLFVHTSKYYIGEKTTENDMGRACSTHIEE
jgi:hypothetical protein